MSIDVYAFATSNGMRAVIMLEEVGADYTLHAVNLLESEHKGEAFRALNPFAQIPVLVDSDGPGGAPVTIEQSGAIMMYLAEKYEKFLPTSPSERVAFWQAFMGTATDVGMTVGTIFAITRMPEPHQPTQDHFEERLRNILSVWEERLSGQAYAAGSDVTVADFALYPVLIRVAQVMSGFLEPYTHLNAWSARIGERPGVAAAMKRLAPS